MCSFCAMKIPSKTQFSDTKITSFALCTPQLFQPHRKAKSFQMATVAGPSTSNLAIKTNAPEYFRCYSHYEGALKRLRGRQDLYDVVLVVGDSGKRISAHRLILIASSDYFSALLSGPMRESQEREITLRDVDGDALEQLVNFCYTGNLELRVDTIKTLITTANYLQLQEITEGCCEFLQRHLQPSNCLDVSFFAEQLNLEALLHNAKKFICEHFDEVSLQPDFFLLTAKQLGEFIASNYLNVPSEEFVFRVLMKWIEYEPENHRNHFTELLAQVRLPLLSPTFLAEEVEPLCNTVESHKLLVSALNSHLQLTSNSTQLMNLLGIYTEGQHLSIAGYNLLTKVWTEWISPMKFQDNFKAILMDDNLIMVGSTIDCSPMNTVTSLNLHTMASTEMIPLQTSRRRHSVAILNGSIYAIGGFDGCDYLNSVERWDPTSGTWSFVASMKDARFDSSVAVMDGYLYVSGGDSGIESLKSVECYDPVENTWRSKAPMKVGRVSHCLAVHNGYLLAIGGYGVEYKDAGIPVERYDSRTDTWTTIPCSPAIYGFTNCASPGPDLFIINKSIIYTISNESNGDSLKLQTLAECDDILLDVYVTEWVAIPFEFRPPRKWINYVFC